MIEKNSNVSLKQGTEKSFGVVFSIVFFLIFLYSLIYGDFLYLWAIILSIILLFFAFLFPKILSIPNKIWFKFGILLGHFMSPIVITFVYFIAVIPTSIFVKLFEKDLLKLKLDKDAKTYWIKRKQNIQSMKNQF